MSRIEQVACILRYIAADEARWESVGWENQWICGELDREVFPIAASDGLFRVVGRTFGFSST
jgi:hypothetical protein